MAGVVGRAHGLWYTVRTQDPPATWIATCARAQRRARRTDIARGRPRLDQHAARRGGDRLRRAAPPVFARTARTPRSRAVISPTPTRCCWCSRAGASRTSDAHRFIVLASGRSCRSASSSPSSTGDELIRMIRSARRLPGSPPTRRSTRCTTSGRHRRRLDELRATSPGGSRRRRSVRVASRPAQCLDPGTHGDRGSPRATARGGTRRLRAALRDRPDTFIADTPGCGRGDARGAPEELE